MESMLQEISRRRSCRKYLKIDISNDILLEILNGARQAPFGGKPDPSCQVVEFVVVKRQEQKQRLALQYEDRQFMTKAPVIIAVLANQEKDPKYKEYVISCALAIQNLLLCAQDKGIGSCVLSCFLYHKGHTEEKKVTRQILQVPEDREVIALVALGYPDPEEEIPEKQLEDLKKIIFYETYGGNSDGMD